MQETGKRSDEHNDNMIGGIKGLRKQGIIAAVAAWQKTVWYPVVFALLGVISASFGWQVYVPVFYVMAVSVVFAALFCDDFKVMLVPIFLAYYCIGSDTVLKADGELLTSWTTAGFVNMIIAGAIMGSAFIWRFFRDGIARSVVRRRGLLVVGFAAIGIAFMFNGVGSPYWEPADLAMGLLESVGLALMYLVILAVGDHTKGLIDYICRLCMICGLMICAQSWILIIRTAAGGTLMINGLLNRDALTLGWGIANIIAGTLAVLIAPTMYFAYTKRYSALSYLAAVTMYVTIIALNARTSIFMGGIILLVCIVLCMFGKNKTVNRMTTACIASAAMLVTIVALSVIGLDEVPSAVGRFFRTESADNGRFGLWAEGMSDFASAPLFGTGFMHGADVQPYYNAFSGFYHNMIVELFGATGIIGVIAFLIHMKGVMELCFRKFRVERLIIGLGAAAVIMTSMLDNFFFYINLQIFYGTALALSELQLEQTRKELLTEPGKIRAGRKPRVVFTFVEAGMGHIVPEKAICDAFERKYGNKTEVVRSHFYTETGDPDMQRFEKGFVKAVMQQSRSKVFGKLCILGNKLSGDALAQRFVMSMRYPDCKADGAALRHMRELDADILFTTHWATTYYANKLGDRRPYTMMLCPDAYSNGMFNMDCNDFFIPTHVGLAKANRRRMYAGGNASVVPYPIRDEAFELRGKKYELRKEAGIGRDEFVVLLADGGYGMAELERTVRELIALKADMRIIAVCGKNVECAAELRRIEVYGPTRLNVYDYADNMLELVCMSDVFVGKSGANSMAEPTFFGMPIIITKCITPIESGIKKYYTRTVGNAMYIPDPKKAAQKLIELASDRTAMEKYIANAETRAGEYGAERIADMIYERVLRQTSVGTAGVYKVINYD